jgi:N-methylhydantoinase B
MEIGSREDAPFAIFARFQRVDFPARGRNGGKDGAAGIVRLASGAMLESRGNQVIPKGDRLIVEMPGGGGLGNAAARDPALVVADVRNGYISRASAREVYRVALRDDGSVDVEATQALRAGE